MGRNPSVVSAAEAVAAIDSGASIYLGSSDSVPRLLVEALCARGRKRVLRDVTLRHIHTGRTEDYAAPEFEGVFRSESFFIGENMRRQIQRGAADYIPISLHDTPRLIRDGVVGCDVAMIQVSPPGRHGRVSLGISVDVAPAAIETAKLVIAVMNRNMPYTYGDGEIDLDRIDYLVEDDSPLEETHFALPNEIERAIGRNCAELVEDGSCLQLGIGAIPNAVLSQLSDRKDLGIHTEMFADGLLPLVEAGVVNGSRKRIDRGKIVASFLMGSRRVYDFVDRNPMVRMREAAYTNDPFRIARNPKVVAINSAIQIDLTGQVCADSLGMRMYSGVGGQLDFIYGASRSEGGRPIIAMPSRTTKGVSKIVPVLDPGAGVVTPRSRVHFVATEYGIVDLYGKPLQQRARLLISIAHPECREELERAAFERFGRHFLYWK
ncbi:acetyl-CoA hydrolase/transferase C-terminal domain-containing protein [uncultured Victivallis sp.]|uniref:acetyl-CoA hydrolase/transferase family protein n=1 Tax=uncultured Victivallis sp. TaxID=354118 RepID=UPI0025EC1565|nr:acetyl-CoA hydrolase/transferase C-terminal domain-containing protein [uncultured Victivallis sp.]